MELFFQGAINNDTRQNIVQNILEQLGRNSAI